MAHTHQTIASVAASACLSLIAAAGSAQVVWHVDADATPGGDGLSWASAFDDLQPAMELAMPGDEIWVAEGVYVPSVVDPIAEAHLPYFIMPDGVAILGGFEGSETSADQRDPDTFESVISGDLDGNDLDTPVIGQVDFAPGMLDLLVSLQDNTGTLLFVDRTGPGTRLDGLVFQGAFTPPTSGATAPATRNGVFVLGASIDIDDCVFRDNITWTPYTLVSQGCGFEDFNIPSHPCADPATPQRRSNISITQTEFVNNYSSFGGRRSAGLTAAVIVTDTDMAIADAVFAYDIDPRQDLASTRIDTKLGQGGVLAGDGSDVTIERTEFIRCRPIGGTEGSAINDVSAAGVAILQRRPAASLTIRDSLFQDCESAEYGVVRGWGNGFLTIERSRFIGNFHSGSIPGGARAVGVGVLRGVTGESELRVANSLFVGNSSIEADDETLDLGPFSMVASAALNADIFNNTFAANATLGQDLFEFGQVRDRNNIFGGEVGPRDFDPLFVRDPDDGGDGWGDNPFTPGVDESLNDDFGDLRLLPNSPAIDAGRNDAVLPGDTDLDGNPRLADDPGIPGNRVDLGAYEFLGVSCLADVNRDGELTPDDFNAWVAAYNIRAQEADQNRDGFVLQNDFNAWVLNFNTGCP